MHEKSDPNHVAWDIETTGFGWSEEITVSEFWLPGSRASLLVNVGPHTVDGDAFEEHLSGACGAPVSLAVGDHDQELLKGMRRVVFEWFDRDYDRLIAYNAESWKGRFDLPFVCTRCIRRGVDWTFEGVLFADLWEPMKKRLNTTTTAYGAAAMPTL